jgi:8-oxo-dGTP pyrophosphatase MutT (NUDIX family)
LDRNDLVDDFKKFITEDSDEKTFVSSFLELLTHPDAFQRYHLPGHLTGSAFIVNADRSRTLLVHHAKLKRWLQPGGHADGQEDLLEVSLREATEETGVRHFHVLSLHFFDIDIHRIPARPDFPQHFHYDVRFLLEASDADPLLISDESTDLKWVSWDELSRLVPENDSLLRMARKATGFPSRI